MDFVVSSIACWCCCVCGILIPHPMQPDFEPGKLTFLFLAGDRHPLLQQDWYPMLQANLPPEVNSLAC